MTDNKDMPETGNAEAAANDAQADEAEITAEQAIDALQTELEEAREKTLRALADAQNTRRRAEKEIADARRYAVTGFAGDLLAVADNLSRALDVARQGELEGPAKTLVDGVAMTERTLLTAFERHGVKKIDPQPGDPFDPNLHQATAQFPSEHASGAIAAVMAPGYAIGDRTLRAAMVAVSSGQAEGGQTSGGSVDVEA
ncbi:MAG: nucleotide exchange factor GrpE [Maricaulis sp.]|jgi:molecular chaperone GrpE|nr:nucleotide exchange factor GrpE [Maricaulis sp.]|tara:strand:+ start:446 stop:1042 length:597 start_codon:yes stop_codon:yes gene_type:complete